MSASENYWEFNGTFSGKMQRVEDVVLTNGADFSHSDSIFKVYSFNSVTHSISVIGK